MVYCRTGPAKLVTKNVLSNTTSDIPENDSVSHQVTCSLHLHLASMDKYFRKDCGYYRLLQLSSFPHGSLCTTTRKHLPGLVVNSHYSNWVIVVAGDSKTVSPCHVIFKQIGHIFAYLERNYHATELTILDEEFTLGPSLSSLGICALFAATNGSYDGILHILSNLSQSFEFGRTIYIYLKMHPFYNIWPAHV